MTILNIKPETYERLARIAAASNKTVDELVEPVLEQLAETKGIASPVERVAAWESFVNGMRDWGEKNLPAGHIVDDSRESIYEGDGE